MKKYENGLFALLFGSGMILFSGHPLYLTIPLLIGFSICVTLQILDIIKDIRGE